MLGQGGFVQFPILSSSNESGDYSFVRASPVASTKAVLPKPVPTKPKPVPLPVPTKVTKKNVFINNMNHIITQNK